MTTLSDLLSEAMIPTRPNRRVGDGRFIVPTSMHESVDPWMSEFMRQVQIVAPRYEAYLKKATGRGFKLFRTFVTDNGRIRVRFDPSKRVAYEFGPMVVMNVAYSKSADLYNAQVDVYASDINIKLGSDEVSDVDIDLLADPHRMFLGVRDALTKVGEKKLGGKAAGPSVTSRAKSRVDDKDSKEPAAASSKPNIRNEGLAGELDRILTEARLGSTAQGSTFDHERANPTKTGPSAERDRTIRGARDGIDRMLKALEVVREWVAKLSLGDKDKTGAARAALRIAMGAIQETEDAQRALAAIVELPVLDLGAIAEAVFAATDALLERRGADQSPDALRAKEGLAKLIDGLRQLQGMLRQAKLTGRVLDQIEAAINGLKATRDAIDGLSEGIDSLGTYGVSPGAIALPPGVKIPYGRFERRKVTEVTRGMWVMGGNQDRSSYHEVRQSIPGNNTTELQFVQPYIGADGTRKSGAVFDNGYQIQAALPL